MSFLRRFHLRNPLGIKGEDKATSFLKSEGFRILERNWKNKTGRAVGEIDIVAKDGKELVFIEVKARHSKQGELILPEESITEAKLGRLSRIAEVYIWEKKLGDVPYRIDALLLVFSDGEKEPELRHFRSIFL